MVIALRVYKRNQHCVGKTHSTKHTIEFVWC